MVSDAQKRANNEYRKRSVKTYTLKFFPGDSDLYEWLQQQENKAQYLKDLMREDMESKE